MPAEEVRYMRLLVFFDLPVKTKDDQREANRFRNFLLRDGYDRVQLSVYARVCRGPENVETHIRRLQKNRCLEVYDVECAGRNRRYYKITDAGRAQLLLYRREWADYSSKISLLFSGEEIK